MRSRLVLSAVVLAVLAAAVFAAVSAEPVNGFPSRQQACTNCHPAAPAGATVSATPSTATPAPGATYSVTIDMSGLTSSGDTGYWIANNAGTPGVSVYGGANGTSQTAYTQTMTAPTSPGAYSYTVWCQKGSLSSGQAKSTTYSITVEAPPAPTPAITSLTPTHGLTGTSVVIAGSNLGTGGTVRFGSTAATTGAWSATSVTATVPASLAPGAYSVTVTPTGGSASNALTYTVDAPPPPPSGEDTTPPVTTASGVKSDGWYNHGLKVRLKAVDESGGSGVASITYSVDGGDPVTVAGSTATAVIPVDRATHANDGPHTIAYYATDVAGNAETEHTLAVSVDTKKPKPKAPDAERVRRYQKASLEYEVEDVEPNGGTARVTIVVRNRNGRIVKVLRLGTKPVDTELEAKFRCRLRPGLYRFAVRASDTAGNRQATVARQTLRVYRASTIIHDDD